jgi:hypothetical protein
MSARTMGGPAVRVPLGAAPGVTAGIDVLRVDSWLQDGLVARLRDLVDAAVGQPGFAGAAVLRGRGWDRAAIYSRWDLAYARRGYAAHPATAAILASITEVLTPDAAAMLHSPESSLYRLALDDARHPGAVPALGPGEPPTFVNVFRTEPARQARLLAATTAVLPVARGHRGYLTTALHTSLDGRRLANIAQYETFADMWRMYLHPRTALRFAGVGLSGGPAWRRGRLQLPELHTYHCTHAVHLG